MPVINSKNGRSDEEILDDISYDTDEENEDSSSRTREIVHAGNSNNSRQTYEQPPIRRVNSRQAQAVTRRLDTSVEEELQELVVQHYTFKNGRSVEIQRVPSDLIQDVMNTFPKPRPPLQSVPTPHGSPKWVENFYDPDYLDALKNYNIELNLKFVSYILFLGTRLELNEKQKLAVRRKREEYELLDLQLDKDDKLVYVKKICCEGDLKEVMELVTAINKLNNPDEETIAEKQESFPGNSKRA